MTLILTFYGITKTDFSPFRHDPESIYLFFIYVIPITTKGPLNGVSYIKDLKNMVII